MHRRRDRSMFVRDAGSVLRGFVTQTGIIAPGMIAAKAVGESRVTDLSRRELHEARSFGERVADGAAQAIGSWRFIIIQTVLVLLWVGMNLVAFAYKWDPYPFILLNLMFSVQAAYTGPILLLASNRQAATDRAMAQRDDQELGLLLTLQQEQMEALRLLRQEQATHSDILHLLRDRSEGPEGAASNGSKQP